MTTNQPINYQERQAAHQETTLAASTLRTYDTLDATPPNYSALHLEALADASRRDLNARAVHKYPHLPRLVEFAEHYGQSINAAAQSLSNADHLDADARVERQNLADFLSLALLNARALVRNLEALPDRLDDLDTLERRRLWGLTLDAELTLDAARDALHAHDRIATYQAARTHLDNQVNA